MTTSCRGFSFLIFRNTSYMISQTLICDSTDQKIKLVKKKWLKLKLLINACFGEA